MSDAPAPPSPPGEGAEPSPAAETREDQRAHRLAKLEALRAAGMDPYPVRFDRSTTAGALRGAHGALEPGAETDEEVRIAGRLLLLRRQGKLSFATLQDRDGEIQLFVDSRVVGEEAHREFDQLDRGDWVGVEGTVMVTRRGELSVKVAAFRLLSKALRPLPDKWHGLTDTDARFRQRYVDLVVNDDARRVALVRIQTISRVRRYLEARGFLEVEGPVLQSIQGGATARPFATHHNALDADLYLRIALELHLKRLIVGGLDRVFEIGRVFRNEGTDTTHNPEFTMLEAYQAFGDYHDMMELTEGIVVDAARGALGDDLCVSYGGRDVCFAPPFRRATMVELIAEHAGVELHPGMELEQARKVLDGLGVAYLPTWGSGRLTNAVYDELVEDRLVQPTFVLDYPREVSPLARAHRDDPDLVERFELVVAGHELANAYSELNDPVDQLARFEAEARSKAGGDAEAGDVDLDYVRALEYGMPPTGGLGLGIDRLVMYLSGTPSIREVILFPTLRAEAETGGPAVRPDGDDPEDDPDPDPRGDDPRGADPTGAGGGPGGAPSSGSRPGPPARGAEARARTCDPPEMGATTRALEAAPPPPVRRSRGPLLVVSWLVAISGLVSVAALVPWFTERLEPLGSSVLPFELRVTGRVATVAIGMLLLVLADQLARGKHRAWQLATAVSALGIVLHLVRGPHPVAAGYSLLVLVLLVVFRDRFRAPADPPSLLRLLRVGPMYLVVVYGFGCLALLLEHRRITPSLDLPGMLETVTLGLVHSRGPYTYHSRFFADFFPAALLALGVFGIVGLAVLVFRPLRARAHHREDDWKEAERLVRAYGWDTLAYFALRHDKSFFFASDGEAMIGYTYMGGYGIASGDPIGRPESVPLVVDEFLAFCRARAWKPAFLAVRERDVALYASRGLRHFYLGDEAIIRCDEFTVEGPRMRGVRQAVRRAGRTYTFRMMRETDASPELVDQLNAISTRWRGKSPERGFTMTLGQDVCGDQADFLLCVAFDAAGKPGAFLRIVPAYGRAMGYTLDLMRHDPGAPNGISEFLIAHTARALTARGVTRLSMNFAAWGRLLDPDVQHSPMQHVAAWGVRKLNPFFQIETLRTFNEKFAPQWLSRVIVYPEPADLPRVGLLYAGAEGFVEVPVLGQLLVPPPVGGVHGAGDGEPPRPAERVA